MATTDKTKQALLKQENELRQMRDAYQQLLSASVKALECYMEGAINAQECKESAETIDNLRFEMECKGHEPQAVASQACDERTRLRNILEAHQNILRGQVSTNFEKALASVLETEEK